MSFIDQAFGISPQVLSLREQRFNLIAGNLANSDTPGYKAVDLGFEQVLAQSRRGGMAMQATQAGHLGAGLATSSSVGSSLAKTMYRVPTQSSLDGNTVETSVEHSEFMKNSIRYQASLGFLGSRIQSLRSVLRGE